jgi:predicted nuclease of predicted toxin-antitoxin system
MKLLLDESIPRKLVASFPDHFEVTTVQLMGWAGTKNGMLLRIAADQGFVALITADKGIEYQQNQANLPTSVVIMRAHRTRLLDLVPLVPKVVTLIEGGLPIGVYHVDA